MKKLTTIRFAFTLVYAVMILAAPVSAITVIHFTGDGDPVDAGFDAGSNSFAIDTDENGPAPGFLYQSISDLNTSPDANPALLGSEGYFVEARFQVLQNNLGADEGFGATIWVDSDIGRSRYRLGTDQLHTGDLYSPAADGFTTFRLECGVPGVSGCTAPDLILDGTNLGTSGYQAGGGGGDVVTFGNHSSGAGAEVVWDYFVVNQEISGEPPAPPTDFTWNSGSGNWNTPGNWLPRGNPGDGQAVQNSHHTVTFGSAISSNSTVFSDTARTLNRIQFDNAAAGYFIAGPGGVNLISSTANPAVPPRIGVAAGSHEFQTPVSIQADTTVDVGSGATLTFNNALNLSGNTLTKSGVGSMVVNNVLGTGGGGMLVGLEGTISGSGTIGGDVTNDGGTISPGNSVAASGVPEPAGFVLMAVGLLGVVGLRRWRRTQKSNFFQPKY